MITHTIRKRYGSQYNDNELSTNNHYQTWELEVPSGQIELTFESFDLESKIGCWADYVLVSHGSFREAYCGSSKGGVIYFILIN